MNNAIISLKRVVCHVCLIKSQEHFKYYVMLVRCETTFAGMTASMHSLATRFDADATHDNVFTIFGSTLKLKNQIK